MISVTPFQPEPSHAGGGFDEIHYLLRRADEESVAAIRATDERVHASHAGMARGYSVRSLEMIARLDGASD